MKFKQTLLNLSKWEIFNVYCHFYDFLKLMNSPIRLLILHFIIESNREEMQACYHWILSNFCNIVDDTEADWYLQVGLFSRSVVLWTLFVLLFIVTSGTGSEVYDGWCWLWSWTVLLICCAKLILQAMLCLYLWEFEWPLFQHSVNTGQYIWTG